MTISAFAYQLDSYKVRARSRDIGRDHGSPRLLLAHVGGVTHETRACSQPYRRSCKPR